MAVKSSGKLNFIIFKIWNHLSCDSVAYTPKKQTFIYLFAHISEGQPCRTLPSELAERFYAVVFMGPFLAVSVELS